VSTCRTGLTLTGMSLVSQDTGPTIGISLPTLVSVPTAAAAHREPSTAGATRRRRIYDTFVKPAMDFVAAVILLSALSPVLLVVALSVRARLGKGVIYRQQRVGRGGEAFTMYKFRSMEPDRRKGPRPFDGADRRVSHKRDDDPRHTPLGRFLRKSRLDELPQLWNVLMGQMSLVGPRPELTQVVERYEPWQHERHQVKPGLTGYWQVSSRSQELAVLGVDLDIDYLRELSFFTDLRVLLRTVPVALRRTGH
jgi:lipopolysaccharide/colanic/teichoic acid biosynthesis glycosyltransferase